MILRPQNKILRSQNQASESTQLCMTKIFSFSKLSCSFDDQLSSNFHSFVIICIYWDTPGEKTCLWDPMPQGIFSNPPVFSTFRKNVTISVSVCAMWSYNGSKGPYTCLRIKHVVAKHVAFHLSFVSKDYY